MKQNKSLNDVAEVIEEFVHNLIAAKFVSITEIENSNINDSSIDVDYVCSCSGIPLRKFVANSLLLPFKSGSYDARRLAAANVVRGLLCGRREVFGYLSEDYYFKQDLMGVGEFYLKENSDDGLSGSGSLVSESEKPTEIVDWLFSGGNIEELEKTFERLNRSRSASFVECAKRALVLSRAAIDGSYKKHSVFFENMMLVFIFCKCAQLMKENSLNVGSVYLESRKLLASYANETDGYGYYQLSISYAICDVFNDVNLKNMILKKIKTDYSSLDHFMIGGQLDSTGGELPLKIESAFFEVFSMEDTSFLRLCIDDKIRASKLSLIN